MQRLRIKESGVIGGMRLPLRIFWILIGVGLILLSLHLSMQQLNLAYNEKHGQVFEISNRLDMDDEASLPTWFSQAIWVLVAAASLLASWLAREKSVAKLWVIMAFIGIFFSIDEVSGIHELSLQSLHLLFFGLEQSSSSLNAWWLVLPLILLFGIWFFKKLYGILRPTQWLLMMAGWTVFMIGALGFELYGNDIPHNTFLYQGVITGTEESLELLGGIIILYVILHHLDTFHAAQINQAWLKLRNKKAS